MMNFLNAFPSNSVVLSLRADNCRTSTNRAGNERVWSCPLRRSKYGCCKSREEFFRHGKHGVRSRPVYAELSCVARTEGNLSTQETYFLQVKGVTYRPPGSEATLLDNVSFSLPEKSLGLLYGPSGSGKTTLLQVLAGLATPTSGAIYIGKDSNDCTKKPHGPGSLSARVGIVFQFPERYFLTDSIVEELMFGWSRQTQDPVLKQTMTLRLQTAVYAVGLSGMPLDMNPRNLSDGYKRRLALAVQLVRMPDIMLLDEPLAGLDWRARADVVKLLTALKKERSLIVVSHDLKELSSLVDKAWQMEMGGILTEQSWPSKVGLSGMPLDMNPRNISDGYKRRLALAVQLVRMPDIMLLDEPLAGLDWRARADVVKLLTALKKERSLIVVSHDLKELSSLVDKAWQMEMGGILTEQSWPSKVTM